MKTLVAVMMLMFSLAVVAIDKVQLPIVDSKVTYQEVVQVPNATQEDLYNRVVLWHSAIRQSQLFTVQLNNKADGVIIINVKNIVLEAESFFTMKIELKEGRYRYELSNFVLRLRGVSSDGRQVVPMEDVVTNGLSILVVSDYKKGTKKIVPIAEEVIQQTDDYCKRLLKSLTDSMQTPTKSSNW